MKMYENVKKIDTAIKYITFYLISFFCYYLLWPKDKNLVVMSSESGRDFSGNTKALFNYIQKNEKNIKGVWITKDETTLSNLRKKYGKDKAFHIFSLSGVIIASKAKTFVFTSIRGDIPYYLGNRSIVQTYHGILIKRMYFLKERKLLSLTDKIIMRFAPKKYTYVTCTSELTRSIFSGYFRVGIEKCIITGQPRNDILFKSLSQKEILSGIYGDPIPECKKVILYAPTWRKDKETRFFPFEDKDYFENFVDLLERKKIILLLRANYVGDADYCLLKSERILICDHEKVKDVNEILPIVDTLITDYSSIYVDFLLLNRPIIFIPYDIEEYSKNWGLSYGYDSIIPGPQIFSMEKLVSELENPGKKEYYEYKRQFVNDLLNYYKDANSTYRVMKLIRGHHKLEQQEEG